MKNIALLSLLSIVSLTPMTRAVEHVGATDADAIAIDLKTPAQR